MTTERKVETREEDEYDDEHFELPACLGFLVCYGMGKYIDFNADLTENFSHIAVAGCRDSFWPWRESMTVLDARYMHVELNAVIEELADLESWASAYRDVVQGIAANSPLSSLLADMAYFRERLDEARAAPESLVNRKRRSSTRRPT